MATEILDVDPAAADAVPSAERCAVLCVRVVLDAHAIPYLMRNVPPIAAMEPGPAKIQEAAGLLRKLRAGWLAVGIEAVDDVTPADADELWQRWQARAGSEAPDADATVVTLLVKTVTSLVLEGAAQDVEDARSMLEAISIAHAAAVLDVVVIADGKKIPFEVARTLPGPPLHEAAVVPHAYCTNCGMPMAPLAYETQRCVECASPIAA